MDLLWKISPPEGAVKLRECKRKTFPIKTKAIAKGKAAAPANFEHGPLSIRPSSSNLKSSSLGTPGGSRPNSSDLHPRWKWGVFFPQGKEHRPWESRFNNLMCWGRNEVQVYYWQTAPGESGGSPTQVWRFGEGKNVCYSRQPDAQEGAVEPTPFCRALSEFYDTDANCTCGGCNCIYDMLGQTTCLLPELRPPEGAKRYWHYSDNPIGKKSVRWIGKGEEEEEEW